MPKIFVLYSGMTDITGPMIAEKLGADHGKNLPNLNRGDTVVAWGAKLQKGYNYDVLEPAIVINHPLNVKLASNKLEAIRKFKEAGVKTPPYFEVGSTGAEGVLSKLNQGDKHIRFPIIGRTKRHQGGTGFFLCIQPYDVKAAISNGAQYFVNHIPIKEEFRLHIFDGKVIDARKKIPQGNPVVNWVNEETEGIIEKIRRNTEGDGNFSKIKDVIKFTLEYIADKAVELPDTKIRSNHRGWKFAAASNPPADLVTEARKAVKALSLTFGAVDCIIGEDNKPYVIEVNTGPGIKSDGTLKAYVNAIKAYIKKEKSKKSQPSTKGGRKGAITMLEDLSDEEAEVLIKALTKLTGRKK